MHETATPPKKRYRWLIAGLTGVAFAAALLVGSRLRSTPEAAPPPPAKSSSGRVSPVLRAAPVTVAPAVHLLGGLKPAVAYAVETSDGLVLVDSGLEADAGPLKRQLAQLGLDWMTIRAILLTHAHADHSLGARHLREAAGAKVYVGRADAGVLKAGGPYEAVFSNYVMPPGVTGHPTPADVELNGDEIFEIGGARFQALATPGHTPGSICYLMQHRGRRVLFAGDVIMSLSGVTPLGTYSTYLPPRYRGDARAFLASLRRLRELPAPDLVLPGHPGMDEKPQNPALSPKRWQALLVVGIRDMEELVGRYVRDGANFLDGAPKTLLPGLYYLGDFKGAAVYGLSAASRFFLVDAPGGPGLLNFVTEQLRKLGVKPATPAAVLLTSCCPEATAGLRELVEKTHTQVVVARAGLGKIKELYPPGTTIIAAEDLPARGWFPVKVIPLRGRGLAPVAYQLTWAGRTVLLSGRLPIKPRAAAVQGLLKDFAEARADRDGYTESLNVLGALKPDLWLPAVPADGQNANAYGPEWENVIADNRKLLP